MERSCAVARGKDINKTKCPGSGTEIIPGKHSDTRIKPLPLTNNHGRYITATPLVSVNLIQVRPLLREVPWEWN